MILVFLWFRVEITTMKKIVERNNRIITIIRYILRLFKKNTLSHVDLSGWLAFNDLNYTAKDGSNLLLLVQL